MRLTGEWPGRVHMRTRWGSARARPRNHLTRDALLSVGRHNTKLIRATSRALIGLGAPAVFSPPNPPDRIAAWREAGYVPYSRFGVMRAPLTQPVPAGRFPVAIGNGGSVAAAISVDQSAFEPEWQYDDACLEDALEATATRALLICEVESVLSGYAVVDLAGPQGFLQRLAVHPNHHRRGIGRALVRAGMQWSRNRGAGIMVLNMKLDNEVARRLYRGEGFVEDTAPLVVMRLDPATSG